MTGFDWNKFRSGGGEIQKWDTPGDQVSGTIVGLRTYEDTKKERTVPLIDVETSGRNGDGEKVIKTVFVDKVDLTRKVVDASPQMGDRIRITFTGTEEGGPMKFFNVELRSNGQKHAPAPEPLVETVRDTAPIDDFDDDGEIPF